MHVDPERMDDILIEIGRYVWICTTGMILLRLIPSLMTDGWTTISLFDSLEID